MSKFNFGRQFKKDLKKYSPDILLSKEWVDIAHSLLNKEALAEKYKDHQLTGNYQDCRECHIRPDLLLIYQVAAEEIKLVRIGTHSELFG
ncbi:MAG: type II toxin-antitoxin system YafQ family toxin [Cardiobacteriaceae bacterium]|nr:type II toxin-antitoxin system YafQ family toxin [Cardiobacteriaceae bacterium]